MLRLAKMIVLLGCFSWSVFLFVNCSSPESTEVAPEPQNLSTEWTRSANNLIINPSQFRMPPTNERGFNTADPCVMFDLKTNKWHAYFSSLIESLDLQVIKHAESIDGETWTVQSAAALELGASGEWDSKSVETCSAHSVETTPGVFKYYLFFSGSDTMSGNDQDIYKIGLATSGNPNTFTRITVGQSPKGVAGLLFDHMDAFPGNSNVVKGLVTDPDVVYREGVFNMWYFCAGQNSTNAYIDGGICHATSSDAVNWVHTGPQASLLNEQSVGVLPQQPAVIFNENLGQYEMWLVIDDPAYASYGVPGLAVGGYYHARSSDGLIWNYSSKTAFDFTWNMTLESEDNGLVTGPDVVYRNGTYYLFYPTFSSQNLPAGYYPFTWGLNLAIKN